MRRQTISNRFLSLSIDEKGRIVSLKNKATKTELITRPSVAEAWRMIVPTGRHTIDKILGSDQTPRSIEAVKDKEKQSIIIAYDRIRGTRSLPIRAVFTLTLEQDSKEIIAVVELDNRSTLPVDEVEFPVIGGLGGFPARGKRAAQLVAATYEGAFHGDVLNDGLPETGREFDPFVREHETAMFEAGRKGVWLDLYGKRQGLYVALHPGEDTTFALKLEKYPKEVTNRPAHLYPEGTARWLRIFGLHVPRLAPGTRWTSQPVLIMPHKGDWHAGADRFSAFYHEGLHLAEPPAWMKNFTGWTEVLGKTYLGEVFHDFRACAKQVAKDAKVTGLDLVFYYGHTALGAEGADFDYSPAPDLGGEKEFRRMVNSLHSHGVRVMLYSNFDRCVNRDVPEYKKLGLEKHAVLDEDGRPRLARWWKETFLSCRRLEGPTPVWVDMCPFTPEWRHYFLEHVTKIAALGVDVLELDGPDYRPCFSAKHGHAPGASMVECWIELIRAGRELAKRLNPDLALIGETMLPEAREVFDGYYSDRFIGENGRIYRYLFPEIRQQTVRVGNYAYDAVNKALMLGIGVNTEIWGLRKTALEACPELARYIGEINRLKAKYPGILFRGTFRDTLGARVKGNCLYSVLQGPGRSKALVVRNPNQQPVKVTATINSTAGLRLLQWHPFIKKERPVARLPLCLTLKPYQVAVLLALEPASTLG